MKLESALLHRAGAPLCVLSRRNWYIWYVFPQESRWRPPIRRWRDPCSPVRLSLWNVNAWNPGYSKHKHFYPSSNESLVFKHAKSPLICEDMPALLSCRLISLSVFRQTPYVVLEKFIVGRCRVSENSALPVVHGVLNIYSDSFCRNSNSYCNFWLYFTQYSFRIEIYLMFL